nr:aldehyde dehydrogenase family protein [Amycolatopsis sp. DSM 110486]
MRKVFFTRGVDSARLVAARAAQGLKQSVFELGGKAAGIFFRDDTVDQAVDGVVTGIFAACQPASPTNWSAV